MVRRILSGGGGIPGPQGPQGPAGSYPFALPYAADTVPLTRISGGQTVFDYLASDDVRFGDSGVPVGRYLAAADNDLRNAVVAALAANPTKVLFLLPPGVWSMTAITEAAGLRDNLVFDGVDRNRCELFRTTNGQMFLFQNDSHQNIVFKNITFRITDPAGNYSASVNISQSTNVLVEHCRFVGTFPSAVTDGIRHGCFLLGGTNVIARHNVFDGVQLQMCGLGRSALGIRAYGNTFLNCNDLGISVNSGDLSGLTLRDIHIHHNEFRGVYGAGYIYVGSDAATTNPDAMSDVVIESNVCSGEMFDLFDSASRTGIIVAWCGVNNRVHVRNNTVTNNNPGVTASQVRGIYAFDRIGNMTSADDVSFADNTVAYIGSDVFEGLRIQGKAITDVVVRGNKLGSLSRGMSIEDCSRAEITGNIVRDGLSNGLVLGAVSGAISDVNVHNNYFRTSTTFKSAILFQRTANANRVWVQRNRLESPENSVIGSGAGSWTNLHYRDNSHNTGPSGTVTWDTNTNNETE